MLISNRKITTKFNLRQYESMKTEYEISSRPWGYYKTMVLNDFFQSKIIYVLPNQVLSLQSHERREEHWTIITGKGIVQLDKSERTVQPGDTVYVPKSCKHRIKNTSQKELLIFSEIQLGDYFGEDDIMRYEDIYGRE